jgi:hypothetical protein
MEHIQCQSARRILADGLFNQVLTRVGPRGLRLALSPLVSRATRRAFERPDPNDPTLTVDNLSDLFLCQTDAEADQTLTVGTLQDFYPTRPSQSASVVEAYLPAASDLAMNADSLDDYFPDKDEAPIYAYEDESGLTAEDLTVETLPVETPPLERPSVEGRYVESEIHRAAVDFQRFAEKFHVFAHECQRGGSRAA